jgi:hypothetical protein
MYYIFHAIVIFGIEGYAVASFAVDSPNYLLLQLLSLL